MGFCHLLFLYFHFFIMGSLPFLNRQRDVAGAGCQRVSAPVGNLSFLNHQRYVAGA